MSRYFIELAYKGTAYNGFQVQENARTIQSEIEQAFAVLHRRPVTLTGSSRTDTGVHALQNYFHFDDPLPVHPQFVYKMNAILPPDIVVRQIHAMPDEAHARFDATGRSYVYRLHRFKDPFLEGVSYFFPYKLDLERMQETADMLLKRNDFFSFSKTNTQVKNFECRLDACYWVEKGEGLTFHISANRFLRGMVRLVTATLLKVGRGKMEVSEVERMMGEGRKAGTSVPAHGLFLERVHYPENYFLVPGVPFGGK